MSGNVARFGRLGLRLGAFTAAAATGAATATYGITDSKFEAASAASAALRAVTDAETGHRLGIWAAARGWLPTDGRHDPPVLATTVAGLRLSNPLGLAAGFDKDAEAVDGLLGLGFGFVEVGSITPVPQPGNPRPRVFRLPDLGAVINRYGFNSAGGEAAQARLQAFRDRAARRGGTPRGGLVGVNLGKNKEQPDAAADYAAGAARFSTLADFLIINVSSPNTPGLRSLQARDSLTALVKAAVAARDAAADWRALGRARPPLFVKVAPDLTPEEAADIAAAVLAAKADGLVVGNTTVSRPPAVAAHAHGGEAGGLSGKPLEALATAQIARFHRLTRGKLPIIGVGGVSDGAGAYAKIRAGASAVEVYTGFAYGGPAMVPRLKADLAGRLAADGFGSVAEAVGVDAGKG